MLFSFIKMAELDGTDLAAAIVQFATDGKQLNEPSLALTDLSSDLFPLIKQRLSQAEEQVKREISSISSALGRDVDGWIVQAEKLHQEIETSRRIAREIVQEAEAQSILEASVKDAEVKVQFVRKELAINQALLAAFEIIQKVQELLKRASKQALGNHWSAALATIDEAERMTADLPYCEGSIAKQQLIDRVNSAKSSLGSKVMSKYWQHLIDVKPIDRTVLILTELDDDDERRDKRGKSLNIEETVQVMQKLGTLETAVKELVTSLDQTILAPCLDVKSSGKKLKIQQSDDGLLSLVEVKGRYDQALTMFANLTDTLDYLGSRLPRMVSQEMCMIMARKLYSRIIQDWLVPALPASAEAGGQFRSLLQAASNLDAKMKWLNPEVPDELQTWVEEVHLRWRNARRERCLEETRQLLMSGFGKTETAERVETELVKQDGTVAEPESQDEWSENWSDDEEKAETAETTPDEDEDTDAWGLNGTGATTPRTPAKPSNAGAKPEGDEEAEAWGWDDDDDNGETSGPPKTPKTPGAPKTPKTPGNMKKPKPLVNGVKVSPQAKTETLTLREQYTITSLPRSITSLIKAVIADADSLLTPGTSSDNPLKPAAGGLYNFPTQILALYRAIGTVSYTADPNGSMYLFNDCLSIGESLTQFAQARKTSKTTTTTATTPQLPAQVLAKLDITADLSLLAAFGQRCYTQCLDSEKLILEDLIEGAQGFQSATTAPFADACSIAVSSCVERIRERHEAWRPVLSRSHLLSATGSLLRTVIERMTLDVMDLGDVSEAESQQLAEFFHEVSALETLFLPVGGSGSSGEGTAAGTDEAAELAKLPLTAVYCSSWLRFQYLSSILEGSLADIQYLWVEGELSYEFEPDEVVDLVQALFSDSNLRRRAVAEVRAER